MKFIMTAALAVTVAGAGAVERKLYVEEFRDRMAGAWLGQSVGVAYGAPTEFTHIGKLIPDGKIPAWKPARVNNTFEQDDLYVEMTFLATMAKRGVDVGPREAGIDFANSRYRLWCANHNARELLRKGVAAPSSSHPKNHPSTDDIDYQIEADFSGILAPGLPARVLRFGETFGRIMNYGDGLYAGNFMGGMYASAYFEKDRVRVVEEGLKLVPSDSGYAMMVRDMLQWYREAPADWGRAWTNAVAKYGTKESKYLGRVTNLQINVKINGAMVLLGYLFGEGDVFRTMHLSTKGGYDSDCNPSSALGVLGVQLGYKAFPEVYRKGLDVKSKWEYTDYDWPGLLEVSERLVRQIVVKEGGSVGKDEKGEYFLLPVKEPDAGAAVSAEKPGPGGDERYTEKEMEEILYMPGIGMGAQSMPKAGLEKAETFWKDAKDVRPGVKLKELTLTEPRLMKAFMMRIDLKTPGISYCATERDEKYGEQMPDYTNGVKKIYTRRETTQNFMKRMRSDGKKIEVAVNTAPWTPWCAPWNHRYADPGCWIVADGVHVHPRGRGKSAHFIIWKDGKPEIRDFVPETQTNLVSFVLSGFSVIAKNGEPSPNVKPNQGALAPRTAFGLSWDDRYLFLLAVDGRQEEYSLGANMWDLCEMMFAAGAKDAMNMDGGGSTSLVYRDQTTGNPIMVNHQPHGGVRSVAVNFGICFEK